MRAFRNFVRSYMQHLPNRAKLLSELSAFLTYTPDKFAIHNVADNLSVVEFFRKLNEILLTDEEVNYDYHWTAFKVIDIAANNSETRQYLIDTVRIIRGVANYAVKGCPSLTEEKQIQVWSFVDRITTGMTIITEEPHLTTLIDHLVASVKRTDLCQGIKTMQISVLTNLCFKNEVAVACLLRFTKSKELLQAIEEHKVHWGKMSMALARFDSTMLEFELHLNLKMIFSVEYFTNLIRNNDQRLLRNVLDMLVVGYKRDEHSRQTMENFDFKESIEAVLTLIDDSEISFQNFELMSVFLAIVNAILSMSNSTLNSSIPRLFKLIVDNTNATNISPEAIKTIRLIASTVADSQELSSFIILLIENLSSQQEDFSAATEVYQLLIELCAKHRQSVAKLPQKSIVKSIDTDTWSYKLTDLNLSMQMRRLQWLFTYDNMIDTDLFRRRVAHIMSMKDVHHIFATGLNSPDEEICALAMELVKSPHFPVQSVSKILSAACTRNIPNNERDCPSPVEIVRPYFSASLEARLNNEVDRLQTKTQNSDVGTSDYTSMLEYQNIVANAKEENLRTQIKMLSDLNSIQVNENGALKLTIRNNLNKISELESKLENSKACLDSVKTGYNTMKLKYDSGTKKINDLTNQYDALYKKSEKMMGMKSQQLAELTAQCDKERETHAANIAQLKKDHDREKLQLEEQLGKQVKDLKEKYTRKEKELKDTHEQDLRKYSAKRTSMKENFEKEKAELSQLYKKEQQAALDKIENLEKELATKIDQVNEYSRELTEKKASLTDISGRLEEAKVQVEVYKKKNEQVMNLLGNIT